MAAKKKSNPIGRFVVYVFTSIVAPIVVSVVAGSVKDKPETPHHLAAPQSSTVTLLPPAPEPSEWTTSYRPAKMNREMNAVSSGKNR